MDQFDMPEAGIDGGGVFKEFLTELGKEAFNENYGLFKVNHEQLLYPNPDVVLSDELSMDYYTFIGRVLGKALYEGILVDAEFAGFFLAKCLGRLNHLDDLPSLDPQLYKGLLDLKHYPGDVSEWGLDFTVTNEHLGTQVTHDLIPNGRNIPVTNYNRIRYIYLVANYRLNVQIDRQCRAFYHGLTDLIHPLWLKLFDQHELQTLIGGVTRSIDIQDLKQHTVYGKDYSDTHPCIVRFWAVVESLEEEMRQKLVKFVTSCSRPPLLGFAELSPKFSIQNTGEQSLDRLPTSSTCVNLLKLPPYTSFESMRNKLVYAIQAAAGFDLS
jgi:ubiquitin-protein ligase E3 C